MLKNKNQNSKLFPILVTTLVVGVAGVTAFQEPTAWPGEGGFMGYLQHLLSGEKSFNTATPNSPSVGEIGLDVATGGVDSSQVVQNPDGDTLERLEYIQENMNQGQDLSAVLAEGNDAGGSVITNVGTPVIGTDAATKDYVDARSTASSVFINGGNPAYCTRTISSEGIVGDVVLNRLLECDIDKRCDWLGACVDISSLETECIISDAVWSLCGGGVKAAEGLVVTPSGCTNSTMPTCSGGTDTVTETWGTYGTTTGVTSTTDGAANTNTLATSYSDTYAAKYCADMVYGGYDDWYLPARNQLNTLYGGKDTLGGFASTYYWSSTENNSNGARIQGFGNGHQAYDNKSDSYLVRCVRSF